MLSQLELTHLYEKLDPVILNVTKKIAYSYRYRYPEDWEDILQAIRIDIWKSLPKLIALSSSDLSLIKLVASASILSFRLNYKKLKKHSLLKIPFVYHTTDLSPFFKINIDDLEGHLSYEAGTSEEFFANRYLSRVQEKALTLNRFEGKERQIVNYLITEILKGIYPARSLVMTTFGISKNKYSFFLRYAETLIKISFQKVT